MLYKCLLERLESGCVNTEGVGRPTETVSWPAMMADHWSPQVARDLQLPPLGVVWTVFKLRLIGVYYTLHLASAFLWTSPLLK